MGMQSITIVLKALATSAATRSERGIVCIVLDDPTVTGVHTYTKLKSVTDAYSVENKDIITRCFSDRGVKTLKVACFNSIATVAETIEVALTALDGVKFNYMACPTATTDAEKLLVNTFVKTQRAANNILVKAVLNNYEGDYEGDINFINNSITMSGITYTGSEFTVDVACVAANCSLKSSLTNTSISGVTSVDSVGSDLNELVDTGKLFLFYDNDLESIVFSRAVNSKTTLATDEKKSLKKIRVIDILDMICDDMKVTFKKNYQGQIDNSLANKKLLVSAYNTYLRSLVKIGALSDSQTSYVELDVNAQANYLEDEKGYDCSNMTDAEILDIDTDEEVFIKGVTYILDVAEDLAIALNY